MTPNCGFGDRFVGFPVDSIIPSCSRNYAVKETLCISVLFGGWWRCGLCFVFGFVCYYQGILSLPGVICQEVVAVSFLCHTLCFLN